MTIAEIHRKVSERWTNSEDVLTSDVFTAFRYLPAESGIVGFLRSIKGVRSILPSPKDQASSGYYFWPLGQTREPDLLLELDIDSVIYHVIVEAKYRSGASDIDIVEIDEEEETILWGNQLADQLRELMSGDYTVWKNGNRSEKKRLPSRVENRLLLYLTAHPTRPRKTLQRSIQLFPEGKSRLFWASWYDVWDYLQRRKGELKAHPYQRIVSDILALLELKQFGTFQGISSPPPGMQVDDGRFWTGRDTPLATFEGIRELPVPSVPVPNGGFWKEK